MSLVAIEQRTTATLQVDVIKGWSLAPPGLEAEAFLTTIGSGQPQDALRVAYREPVPEMSADCGFDEVNACMVPSQAGRFRLGNMAHHGGVDFKKVSGFMMKRQQRGGVRQ